MLYSCVNDFAIKRSNVVHLMLSGFEHVASGGKNITNGIDSLVGREESLPNLIHRLDKGSTNYGVDSNGEQNETYGKQ